MLDVNLVKLGKNKCICFACSSLMNFYIAWKGKMENSSSWTGKIC